MLVKLEKEFKSGGIKTLFSIDIKQMDEYLIHNFQDELDLEIYFGNMSYYNEKDGNFRLVNARTNERMSMYFRSDLDNFNERKSCGMFDNINFVNILFDKCSDCFNSNKVLSDDLKLNIAFNALNNEKFVRRNFRNIYSAVKEYSLKRIEEERHLEKTLKIEFK